MDKERLNLSVEPGTGDLLTRLAGGERLRGAYLSKLLHEIAESGGEDVTGMDVEALRLMVQGLGGRVKSLEGELVRLQAKMEGSK